jgi:hypothetical protein
MNGLCIMIMIPIFFKYTYNDPTAYNPPAWGRKPEMITEFFFCCYSSGNSLLKYMLRPTGMARKISAYHYNNILFCVVGLTSLHKKQWFFIVSYWKWLDIRSCLWH